MPGPQPLLLLVLACAPGSGDTGLDSGGSADAAPWFEPATLQPAFEHVNASWAGVALLDFDLDGWTDLFLPNGRNAADALYRNQGDGSFVDVAAEAGVASLHENGGALAADLDNDGDPDLVVNTVCTTGTWSDDGDNLYDGGKLLYRNRGDGTFEQVDLGLPPELAWLEQACTISMTAADVDNDGFLDLVLANGHDLDVAPPWIFEKRAAGAVDAVLYNDGTGRFDTAWVGTDTITSFVHAVADLDGDGTLDLLKGAAGTPVGRWTPLDGRAVREDALGTDSGMGLWMGLALADFDRDRDLDLYATNQGLSPYLRGYDNTVDYYPTWLLQTTDPDSGEPVQAEVPLWPFHAVLPNEGGRLGAPTAWPLVAEQALAGDAFTGTGGEDYTAWVPPTDLQRYPWGWGAVALDVDADGWMDVAWTGNNGTAPLDVIDDEAHAAGPGGLLRNLEGQGFEDVTWQAGVANTDALGRYQDGRGVAVGDLNRDGYPDLVVANRTTNPSLSDPLAQRAGLPGVWLSRPRAGHWLVVEPVGTVSNRDAIGGELRVHHGEQTLVLPIGAGGTTCSSSAREVIVGLGDWTEVDLELRFPSGIVVERSGVAADQRLVIEEAP